MSGEIDVFDGHAATAACHDCGREFNECDCGEVESDDAVMDREVE